MLTGVEIKRKIVHFATLILPVGYGLTSRETVVLFLVPFFLALLAVDLLRHYHPGMASLFQKYFFGRVLREEEKATFMGSTYFIFSTLLTILLFPKAIAIASILILIVSDTAAALIGKIGPESTDYFLVGSERGPFRMRAGGRLFLGINDDNLADNSGNFPVTVYF